MLHLLNKEHTIENLVYFLNKLKCQRCAACCNGIVCKDGVSLMDGELEKLSLHLGISKRQFKDKYTIVQDNKRLIKFPCPFLKEKGCMIYVHRPQVCRQFPLNQSVPLNGRRWMTAADCPAGILIGEKYGLELQENKI